MVSILTDNMVKIQLAIQAGAIVRNEKGERIILPSSNDGKRSDDCIKCYIKDMYYWSTARIQKELLVNELPFERWFEMNFIITF